MKTRSIRDSDTSYLPSDFRAESSWWHGVTRLRPHVLPAWFAAVAKPQSGNQAPKVWAHQREEDVDADRGAVQELSQLVPHFLSLTTISLPSFSLICFNASEQDILVPPFRHPGRLITPSVVLESSLCPVFPRLLLWDQQKSTSHFAHSRGTRQLKLIQLIDSLHYNKHGN